mgnify:FL=1
MTGRLEKLSIFYLVLGILMSPLLTHQIRVDSTISGEFVILLISTIIIFTFIIIRMNSGLIFYMISFISFFLGGLIFFSGDSAISASLFLAGAVALGPAIMEFHKDELYVSSLTSIFFILLLFLSTSLRIYSVISITGNYSGYLFSIYDNVNPAGVPWTYAWGLVLSVGRITLTVSPLTMVLFPSIAFLTSSNTLHIIRIYKETFVGGFLSSSLTALSCQCEATIGVVSGTVSAYLLSLLPFLIILSLIMLLITRIYIFKPFKFRLFIKTHNFLYPLFIIILILQSAIIFDGLIKYSYYFAIVSFLSISSGITAGLILPIKNKNILTGLFIGIILEIFSFTPLFVRLAVTNSFYFELYSVTGFIAGIIFSLTGKGIKPFLRNAIFELVFSMQAMMAIVALYITLFSGNNYYFMDINGTIEFSLTLIIMTLPLMWVSNLNLIGKEIKLNRENKFLQNS